LAVAGWAVTSQTARYALPAAALVASLAAAGLARISPWIARTAAAALGVAVLHGALTLGFFLFGSLGIQRAWLGAESREAWRQAVTLNDPAAAYRAADTLLDRDARILIVGEGRPWQCPRPHQVSSPYDTPWLQAAVERSATAADVRKAALDAGFTHLLINWAEVNRLGGEDYRVMRWKTPEDLARFREFGKSLTDPVWAEGPLEIRAIRR
jgi:membrane protein implicated in regulation of membrane protease activity